MVWRHSHVKGFADSISFNCAFPEKPIPENLSALVAVGLGARTARHFRHVNIDDLMAKMDGPRKGAASPIERTLPNHPMNDILNSRIICSLGNVCFESKIRASKFQCQPHNLGQYTHSSTI